VAAAPAKTVMTAGEEVIVPVDADTFAVPAAPTAVTSPDELTVAIAVEELE
jgi:hypothetical protein